MPKQIDTDSLFTAAVQVFAERGYDAATTLEIAKRAGVKEATLFRRYGTKASLIGVALKHCLTASPFGHLAASADLRSDLLRIVTAYQQTYQAYGGAVLALIIEMARQPDLRAASSALMPNLRAAAAIIAHHQQSGQLAPGDPLQKLILLLAPVMMSGLWARTGVALPMTQITAETVVAAFLHGHAGEISRG